MAALRICATVGILILAAFGWLASRRSECGLCGAQSRLTLRDHAGFERMLRIDPELVRVRDKKQQTLLHAAAAGNDVEAVRALLAHGADVNARDAYDETPLHMAAMGSALDDRVALAEVLLAAGAQLDARDFGGRTPLHTAGIFSQKRLVDALEHAGADPTLADATGRTAAEFVGEGDGNSKRAGDPDVAAKPADAAGTDGAPRRNVILASHVR